MSTKPHTVIVVGGPTAVGKTAVAIQLAEQLEAEIINADSRQVYMELNIGVAKPSPGELQRIQHHLIGTKPVSELYGAGDFETEALAITNEIFSRGKKVILCGGTGMYIKAFCEGLDELPTADENYRQYLHDRFSLQGITFLQEELRKKDPEALERIDIENPQRLMRALEVIQGSGKPYSASLKGKKAQRPFNIVKIGLNMDRAALYARINQRTEEMMKAGLLQEVQGLYAQRHYNALKTVGYKELFDYLDGHLTLEQAIDSIKQHTRNYAKRQLTWFRADVKIHWFEPARVSEMLNFIHTKS